MIAWFVSWPLASEQMMHDFCYEWCALLHYLCEVLIDLHSCVATNVMRILRPGLLTLVGYQSRFMQNISADSTSTALPAVWPRQLPSMKWIIIKMWFMFSDHNLICMQRAVFKRRMQVTYWIIVSVTDCQSTLYLAFLVIITILTCASRLGRM